MNDYFTRYETVRLEHQERLASAERAAFAESTREPPAGTALRRSQRWLGLRLIRLGIWLSFPPEPPAGHPASP